MINLVRKILEDSCRDERIFLTRPCHKQRGGSHESLALQLKHISSRLHRPPHSINFLSFLIHSSLCLCTNTLRHLRSAQKTKIYFLSHSPRALTLGRSFSYVFGFFPRRREQKKAAPSTNEKFSLCERFGNGGKTLSTRAKATLP